MPWWTDLVLFLVAFWFGYFLAALMAMSARGEREMEKREEEQVRRWLLGQRDDEP